MNDFSLSLRIDDFSPSLWMNLFFATGSLFLWVFVSPYTRNEHTFQNKNKLGNKSLISPAAEGSAADQAIKGLSLLFSSGMIPT